MARPVQPIPYKRYVQIYKAAAKWYGFAEDWYVLAAVGSAESNHGENMAPPAPELWVRCNSCLRLGNSMD